LVRAHGSSLSVIKKALKLNYMVIDATCPMVKEIHRIAQSEEKSGFRIIIIGDKDHDEVRVLSDSLKPKLS